MDFTFTEEQETIAEIAFTATNSLGEHVSGTATLSLLDKDADT